MTAASWSEVAGGTIEGSISIPLPGLTARIVELDPDVPIATACPRRRHGQRAAEAPQAAGFTVTDLDGGSDWWPCEGHATP